MWGTDVSQYHYPRSLPHDQHGSAKSIQLECILRDACNLPEFFSSEQHLPCPTQPMSCALNPSHHRMRPTNPNPANSYYPFIHTPSDSSIVNVITFIHSVKGRMWKPMDTPRGRQD